MKKNIRILIGRFRHWSLKYKILTIVLFNSVTMLLCAVFGYRLYTNAYNKLLFDSMASRLSVTSAQISQKMENAEYISNLILGSSSIQDCLSDLPSPEDAPRSQNITVPLIMPLQNTQLFSGPMALLMQLFTAKTGNM